MMSILTQPSPGKRHSLPGVFIQNKKERNLFLITLLKYQQYDIS